jgi:hypothetical protein
VDVGRYRFKGLKRLRDEIRPWNDFDQWPTQSASQISKPIIEWNWGELRRGRRRRYPLVSRIKMDSYWWSEFKYWKYVQSLRNSSGTWSNRGEIPRSNEPTSEVRSGISENQLYQKSFEWKHD